MTELNEDRLYKNYVFHPIWKNEKQIGSLFKMKDFDYQYFSEIPAKHHIELDMLDALLHSNTIFFYNIPDDKKKLFALYRRFEKRKSIMIRIRELRFVDENATVFYQNVLEIKTRDGKRIGYIMLSEDIGRVKYLYSVIPEKLSSMKITSIIKDISPNFHSDELLPFIEEYVEDVIGKKRLSMAGVNKFLSEYERDVEAKNIIPDSIRAYYVLRNALPSGWGIALDFKGARLILRFSKPVIVRNAYVRDKITPLKVPMWLERIYLTLDNELNVGTKGLGWHNDLSSEGINEFSSLCTGELKVENLRKAIRDNDASAAYEFLRILPSAMSVANLDHPHWQFSKIGDGILAEIQVIGEEKEDDDMVITRTDGGITPVPVADDTVSALPIADDDAEETEDLSDPFIIPVTDEQESGTIMEVEEEEDHDGIFAEIPRDTETEDAQ